LTGREVDADLVVIGAGVRPYMARAQPVGIEADQAILVNAHLETSSPDIFVVSSGIVRSRRSASSATLALNSAVNRLRVFKLDCPSHRAIHLRTH
jgi:hypothetical protein